MTENPANFGSRGCEMRKLDNKWWEGSKWLQNQTQWPETTFATENSLINCYRNSLKKLR